MHQVRVDILGIPIDPLTWQGALAKARGFLREEQTHFITTPNPEIIMRARRDEKLRNILLQADLSLPDGIGVVWAGRVLGFPVPHRIPGIEFMDKLLSLADEREGRVFLLGTHRDTVARAAANIGERFKGLEKVGYHHGYFSREEEDGIVEQINSYEPDFLFVGLGVPKEQKWVFRNLSRLRSKVVMTIGGSLDVYGEEVSRAPVAVRRLHLEWLYRLISSPARLKRQLALPKFVLLVFKEALFDDGRIVDGRD